MSNWVALIAADQVPEDTPTRVRIADICLLVCFHAGRYFVTDCECPHAGGPLVRGDIRDGCILCPVHNWAWKLDSGDFADGDAPELHLSTYPCELRDGVVCADLSSHRPRPETGLDCRTD